MPHVNDIVICIKNYPLADFCFLYLSIFALFLLVEIKNNSNIMVKYHPKFWTEGIYQCCRQTEKLAPGCEKYSLFENSMYICFLIKFFWHIFLLFYMILSSHLNALGIRQIYRADSIIDTVPKVSQN